MSRHRLKLRSSAILFSALLCGTSGCQSFANWARAIVSPLDWGEDSRIELRLTPDEGGRPTVPIEFMNREVAMLLDSGSSGGGVSRDFAIASGVETTQRKGKVNGQKAEHAKDLRILVGGKLMEANLVVHDASFSAPVTIGAYLFLQAVVDMDFEAQRVAIVHPDAFVPPSTDPVLTTLWYGVPTVQVEIPGHPARVCAIVDTGYNGGIALSDQLVTALDLPKDLAGGTTTMIGALGERWERATLAPLQEVRVGGLSFRNVRVAHSNRAAKCSSIIGMEVLSQHRIIFDLKNRRMWFLPHSGPDSESES